MTEERLLMTAIFTLFVLFSRENIFMAAKGVLLSGFRRFVLWTRAKRLVVAARLG